MNPTELHRPGEKLDVTAEALAQIKRDRILLAVKIRDLIFTHRVPEEVRQVFHFALLPAGLDQGLNEAVFPTQAIAAKLASLPHNNFCRAILWAGQHNMLERERTSFNAVSPSQKKVYVILPPDRWKDVPLLPRFLPRTEEQKKLLAQTIAPDRTLKQPELDADLKGDGPLRQPYGINEASQDDFEAGSVGELSPPKDEVRANTQPGPAALANPQRPSTAGAERSPTAGVAAAPRETGVQSGAPAVSSPMGNSPQTEPVRPAHTEDELLTLSFIQEHAEWKARQGISHIEKSVVSQLEKSEISHIEKSPETAPAAKPVSHIEKSVEKTNADAGGTTISQVEKSLVSTKNARALASLASKQASKSVDENGEERARCVMARLQKLSPDEWRKFSRPIPDCRFEGWEAFAKNRTSEAERLLKKHQAVMELMERRNEDVPRPLALLYKIGVDEGLLPAIKKMRAMR